MSSIIFWLLVIAYFAGMFWYSWKRFKDDFLDDDFFIVSVACVLVAFWPVTLILDLILDVKY